ncbi:MAG: DUF4838 domain-containing protein [Planctomycetota bacterium]
MARIQDAFLVLMSAACCATSFGHASESGLVVVQAGHSEYSIVVDKDAIPSEHFAAEELVTHLQQMTGVTVPVQNVMPGNGKAIVLGFTAASPLGVLPDASLGKEGFLLKQIGSSLVIAGGRPRGTLYGVYSFLDRLGVRWWTPTERYVPTQKTVVLPALDVRDVPALYYRDMMYRESFSPAGRLWSARNRQNGMAWEDKAGEELQRLGGRCVLTCSVSGNIVHSYHQLLSASGVAMKEDMKALKKGKRNAGQPCLSSPDVLAAITKVTIAALRADPDLEFVEIGQEDNDNFCECPSCAAIDAQEDSHAGQVIHFVNQVAEAVDRELPGRRVSTAAYTWSRTPPKRLKVRDNVNITLCSIECDLGHPLGSGASVENKKFRADIEGWGKIAKSLLIWHYSGNRDHYLMPNPDWFTFAPDVQFYCDNQVRGLFVQGTHVGSGTEFSPLRMWVWARAMANPRADGRALIAEFVNGYYGPAAQPIMQYMDLIAAANPDTGYHLGRRAFLDAPFLKPEVMAEAESLLRSAEAKAKGNAEFERRVRHARLPLTYVLFKRGPGSKTWAAVERKVGHLDAPALASDFAKSAKEYSINLVGDPEDVQPWLDWMKDYAQCVSDKQAPPVPPELVGQDLSRIRLIQACQMDGRSRYWKRVTGASDGWAVEPMKGISGDVIHPSPVEDYEAGKSYRIFARVKRTTDAGAGGGFSVAVFNKQDPLWWKTRRIVKKEEVASSAWIGYEICTRTFIPGDTISFEGDGGACLDCLWLVEAERKP